MDFVRNVKVTDYRAERGIKTTGFYSKILTKDPVEEDTAGGGDEQEDQP